MYKYEGEKFNKHLIFVNLILNTVLTFYPQRNDYHANQ